MEKITNEKEVKVEEPIVEVTESPKIYNYIVNTKADFLNVRSTPDASNDKNIIGRVGKGDEIETFGKQNGFLKIRYGGQDAWVMASKLRRTK